MQNQEILEEFDELEKNSKFITQNYECLQKQYGDKFIVVAECSVQISSDSFKDIQEQVIKNKINLTRAVIQFLPKFGQIVVY